MSEPISIDRLCLDDCIREREHLRELNAELLAKLKAVVRYVDDPFTSYLPDLVNEIRAIIKSEKPKAEKRK